TKATPRKTPHRMWRPRCVRRYGRWKKLGAQIVPTKLPDMGGEELINAWFTITSVEALAAHERTYRLRGPEYGAYFRNLLNNAVKIPATAYTKATQIRADFTDDCGVVSKVSMYWRAQRPHRRHRHTIRRKPMGPMVRRRLVGFPSPGCAGD